MRSQLTASLTLVVVIAVAVVPGLCVGAEPAVTVELSSIDALLGEVAVLVERLDLPMPEPALVGMVGNAIKALGLVGIDRTRPLQLHVLFPELSADVAPPSPDALKPSVALVLPVTGDGSLYLAALAERFSAPVQEGELSYFAGPAGSRGGGLYVGRAEGYVIVGGESPAVGDVTAGAVKNGTRTGLLLDQPGTLRAGVDAQLLVPFIEAGARMMLQGLEQQEMPPDMPMDPARILKAEIDALLGLLRQVEGLAIGIAVRDDAVDFHSRVDPVSDSVMAQVIRSLAPPSAKYASFVPADALLAVSGSGMNTFDTIAEPWAKLVEDIYGAMGPELSAIAPTFRKAMEDVAGLYAGDYAIGVVSTGDGHIGLIEAIALTDAAKAKQVMDEMMATYNDTWAKAMPGITLVRGPTRSHRGVEIQNFSYDIDEAALQQSPTPMPMATWLGNMTWEIAYAGDSLVYTMGGPEMMDGSIDRMASVAASASLPAQFTKLIPSLSGRPVQTYSMSLAGLTRALLALSPAITDEMLAGVTGDTHGAAGYAVVSGDSYIDFDRISIDEIVALKNMAPLIQTAFMQFATEQAAAQGNASSFTDARETARRNACINNMRILDSAKEQWAMANRKREGEAVDKPGALQYVKGAEMPVCPAGGVYTMHTIGKDPECSVHGSMMAAMEQRPVTRAPVAPVAAPASCRNGLRIIDAAKEQWALAEGKADGAAVEIKGISDYIKGGTLPRCPQGGAYTVGPIGTDPTCSVEGHGLR